MKGSDMSDHPTADVDLTRGIPMESVADGSVLAGRVGEDDVLLVRGGGQLFAVRAQCTHYRGPLADGIVVGNTIRCPLHHACFDLATGEALRAPALDPLPCWRVERQGATVFVREPLPTPTTWTRTSQPSSIVIVGGGAAGLAAADMLRRGGYDGAISMFGADADPPVDRPNLSKDYLAGEAQDDWIPLWPSESYAKRRIDLVLRTRAELIEPATQTVLLDDGSRREFGALLIATGLRTRGAGVTVVAPESRPLARVMGEELGGFVQALHEARMASFSILARRSPRSRGDESR
jgi:nitrite reductase/ring-hydroxylating ferredoxin subunit